MNWIAPQDLLLHAAAQRPVTFAPALDQATLAQRALRLAGALQARGIQRVALYLEDGAELAIALLGAWRAGIDVLLPADAQAQTRKRLGEHCDLWLDALDGLDAAPLAPTALDLDACRLVLCACSGPCAPAAPSCAGPSPSPKTYSRPAWRPATSPGSPAPPCSSAWATTSTGPPWVACAGCFPPGAPCPPTPLPSCSSASASGPRKSTAAPRPAASPGARAAPCGSPSPASNWARTRKARCTSPRPTCPPATVNRPPMPCASTPTAASNCSAGSTASSSWKRNASPCPCWNRPWANTLGWPKPAWPWCRKAAPSSAPWWP